jgi:hypothetical protein
VSGFKTPHLAWIGLAAGLLIGLVVIEFVRTAPVRGAVRTYTKLIASANRQDLAAARDLCSIRYLRDHPLATAPEGGIVGLPRGIHPNFRAWREGEAVWLCPTNRVGPVFRFVHEGRRWKFDGPVGLLGPDGRVEVLGPGSP